MFQAKKHIIVLLFQKVNKVVCDKAISVQQNVGIGGLMGTGVKNASSKVPYLESPTLICVFTVQLLWGYDDD